MHLIKNWVRHNSFKDNPVGVFYLLRCVELKELSDGQIKSITDQVKHLKDYVTIWMNQNENVHYT